MPSFLPIYISSRWRLLAQALAAVTLLTGCLATGVNNMALSLSDAVAPKVTFLVPARSAEAATVRRIGIAADQAEASQRLAVSLESGLNRLRIDEKPYHDLVKLGPRFNGMPSDAQLVGTGRSLSVDGMLLLHGANTTTRRNERREERVSCSGQTKLFQVCPKERQQKRQVSCITTEGLAAVRVRMVRVTDGRVILSDTVNGQSEHRRCSDDDGTPQANPDDLMAAALASALASVQRTIAPTYEQRPLDLKGADAGLPQSAMQSFEAGMQFARARRMDEACRRFEEIYLDHKESAALTFNVGFCQEVRGDLLKASQAYRRSSEVLGEPNAQVDRRLALVETAIRENPVAFMPGTDGAQAASAPAAEPVVGNGRRVALVIGNASYQRSALVNPVNDARLVGNQLRRIGFDVTIVENASTARLGTAARDFAARARSADVALFYYAGHAIQAEGENYLLPVDNAKMRTLEDVRNEGGLQLGEIQALLDVANPRVKLLVLDACRDNPLPAATRSLGGGGLAVVKRPAQGSLVAFATAPGRTAEDGAGRNSVFSKHFAAQLAVPGQSVEQVFKRVREAVKAETRNRQEPTEVSSLIGDIVLTQAKP